MLRQLDYTASSHLLHLSFRFLFFLNGFNITFDVSHTSEALNTVSELVRIDVTDEKQNALMGFGYL